LPHVRHRQRNRRRLAGPGQDPFRPPQLPQAVPPVHQGRRRRGTLRRHGSRRLLGRRVQLAGLAAAELSGTALDQHLQQESLTGSRFDEIYDDLAVRQRTGLGSRGGNRPRGSRGVRVELPGPAGSPPKGGRR
jgi:hypothetical protein